MNLQQTEFLLSIPTQEYLAMLYRQSKITGSVQINFIAAKLGLSPAAAAKTAQQLQETGFIRYEKYGMITLTQDGKRYGKQLVAGSSEEYFLKNL